MKAILFLLLAIFLTFPLYSQNVYFPDNEWEKRDARELKLDSKALDEAVQFAQNNEYSGSRDLRIAILKGFAHEPFHEILGPVKKRGGPAGMIIKNGYVVAEWGETDRVDMTFSVTKSYLSTVAGLASDVGMFGSVDDKLEKYVWDGTFRGEHNSKITWRDLLTQSSDWSGELFGVKDWADRPPKEGDIDDWKYRELKEPGTFFEYNDVRVNVLAYSLLQLWRKPLPQVMKENLMDKIGASSTWRWYGYGHSFTLVDGVNIQSVSGGGHSGGGLFINTQDHARFGLLFARNGKWKNEQLLSENWIEEAIQPSKANKSYGFMWWLNKGPRKWQEVDDESIFYAAGFGGNFIVIDQKNDLVIVTRWLEPSKIGEMVKKVIESTN